VGLSIACSAVLHCGFSTLCSSCTLSKSEIFCPFIHYFIVLFNRFAVFVCASIYSSLKTVINIFNCLKKISYFNF
jgi:hypothetical protein